MGESTYARGELTIPAAAIDTWASGLDIAAGDAAAAELVSQLTDLVTENAYTPIEVHYLDDGLHIEVYGDYHSGGLKPFLDELARSGATGRVLFPEDGMWGYILTPDGVREAGGALLAPGDELLLLTLEMPGQDRHEALYAHDGEARDAMDRAVATHRGREHRTRHLSDAMAAVAAAGGSATCRPVKLCP